MEKILEDGLEVFELRKIVLIYITFKCIYKIIEFKTDLPKRFIPKHGRKCPDLANAFCACLPSSCITLLDFYLHEARECDKWKECQDE